MLLGACIAFYIIIGDLSPAIISKITGLEVCYQVQFYWVTICKTVRHVLSDHCPVCLSCLSVMLVYCGQTIVWIKMKLGMEVGRGPSHIVLGGDPAFPQKGHSPPNFRSMSVVAKWLDGSRCHLVQR